MGIIHLEPNEFYCLAHKQKKIDAHPYVLDNGLATMIYMFQSEGMIVFLDRIFTYNDCVNQDWEGYHAQIYSKIALDMKLRMTLC